jgi:hypothetical protein
MELTEVGRALSAASIKTMQSAIDAMTAAMKTLTDMMGMTESLEEAARDPNVGGGVDRSKLPAQDFAGKNRSFPIVTPQDVADAATSIGRAGPDNYSTDELKTRIIAIAKRKGADFEAKLPKAWQAPTKESAELDITGETVMLIEKAVRRDGTVPIKLIAPGWGSSGYYSKEVLQRDGPTAFPAKTQMFWDHQTPAEEAAKPEGALNNLAAVLVSGATYQEEGLRGPGLYADAKPFEQYKPHIEDMAADIGTSIRARGIASQGEAEGRKGSIIEKISQGISVDFVTKAGAGGQVVTMFEAARGAQIREAIKESQEVFEVNEQEAQTLREAADKATKDNETLKAEVARLKEVAILGQAHEFAKGLIEKADLPELTKKRLIETTQPYVQHITKEGGLDTVGYGKVVESAVTREREYIAALSGSGAIKGMGGSGPTNADADHKALIESYANLYRRQGKTQDEAQKLAESAANGR